MEMIDNGLWEFCNWSFLEFEFDWLHHIISVEPFCGDLDASFAISNPTKGRFTCAGYRVPTPGKMGKKLRQIFMGRVQLPTYEFRYLPQ